MVNSTLKSYSDGQIEAGFVIKGDAGDDVISGGLGPDQIEGGSGNDQIAGGAGADRLLGGEGNDTLSGTMDDTFDGGRGIDTLDLSGSPTAVGVDLGGYGAFYTQISSTPDPDGYLDVDLGDTQLEGVARAIENIIGSSYNDWLMGNYLENIIRGGSGDDVISPGLNDRSTDFFYGDDGNDEIFAGGGDDQLTGGSGADMFVFDPVSNDGDWVIQDYSKADGDQVLLFPYDGALAWSPVDYLGTPSMQATFDGGDTLTFVGVTAVSDIDMASTMSWPGP
jgi:Ca2+-binding RTX toxin-like protein